MEIDLGSDHLSNEFEAMYLKWCTKTIICNQCASNYLSSFSKISFEFLRFDTFNSRTKYSKKKLECGFGVHLEEQTAVIQKMMKAVEKMRCLGKRAQNLPFQKGIMISSQSLLGLREALHKRYKVDFLLTSHLNQDCIENLFSRVRALGGSYTHPTSTEFIYRMRKLIVGKASDLVIETAPVEMADDCSQPDTTGFLSQLATRTISPGNQT